ncbi:MAG TPA: plastocyanin/azurin family copper-binding protein [Solirubrobacteraceae bacterium]|jgi:plastocyanin|nr:plastocyanin/azurin family copper-binding protein [Solirubrobacteraceae bacterium]
MRGRTLAGALVTLAVAAGAAIPALAAGSAHSASTHTVTLSHIRFHPAALSIKRGDTVRWLWEDKGTEHNVTGKGFKSRTMTKGSFSVRFTKSGTFSYHCTIHVSEGMVGKVVVH